MIHSHYHNCRIRSIFDGPDFPMYDTFHPDSLKVFLSAALLIIFCIGYYRMAHLLTWPNHLASIVLY